jgi:ribosomal-protein-alanine N-acetyltransferase
MLSSDLTSVLQIERNVQIAPWSRLSFEESLTRQEETLHGLHPYSAEKPKSTEHVLHRCQVICGPETVLGFHISSLILDEFHILNLAVAPQYQGLGLGHFLLKDILELAQSFGAKKLFLEVRASNEKARSLYEKWQFRQIGIRKSYYRNGGNEREDALIFCLQV